MFVIFSCSVLELPFSSSFLFIYFILFYFFGGGGGEEKKEDYKGVTYPLNWSIIKFLNQVLQIYRVLKFANCMEKLLIVFSSCMLMLCSWWNLIVFALFLL